MPMLVSMTDQYMAPAMTQVGLSELSIGGIYVIRIMEETQALHSIDVSQCLEPLNADGGDSQESQTQNDGQTDLLPSRHPELDDQGNW